MTYKNFFVATKFFFFSLNNSLCTRIKGSTFTIPKNIKADYFTDLVIIQYFPLIFVYTA